MSRSLVFARRRARFFDGMKEGVALLFATPEAAYSHDVHYRYRPDPDLFYLTGFTEPEAAAVLDADLRTFTLFVRPKDRSKETWEGRRSGPEGAVRDHGADRAYPFGDLSKRLPDLVRRAHVLHYVFGAHAEGDRIVASLLARFRRETRNPKRGPATVADPTDLLHAMRLVKAPEEIVLMERSAVIAVAAHREAQCRGHARRGAVRCQLAQPRQRRPGEERAGQTGEQGNQPTDRPVAEKRTLHDHTEQDGPDRQAEGRRDADGHGRREVAAGAGRFPSQARIDEPPRPSLGRSQLVPLSVTGDVSKPVPATGATGPGCAGLLSRPRKTQ